MENKENTTKEQKTDPTKVTETDLKVLNFQLNRKNFIPPDKIMRRCKWGYPQVTFSRSTCDKGIKRSHAMSKVMVPGTLLWISCPRIHEFIASLEAAKHLQEIQRKVDDDEEFQKKFLESHEHFNKFLQQHLTKEEFVAWYSGNRVRGKESIEGVKQIRFGNAGVSVPTSVKCFHAHTAALLAGVEEEIIGKIAFKKAVEICLPKNTDQPIKDIEDLTLLDCPDDCVRCRNFLKKRPNDGNGNKKKKFKK